MNKLVELRRQKAELIEKMRGMLNKADDEKRAITDEETTEYDGLDKSLDALTGEIKKYEQAETRKEKLKVEDLELHQIVNPAYRPAISGSRIIGGVDRSYRGLFHGSQNVTLETNGFKDFREFMNVLATGRYDQRLEARTFLEKDGTAGGFAVPEEFSAQLFDDFTLENEIVRPRAQLHPMKSATKVIAGWDSADHASALYGGWTISWLGENEAGTIQTAKVRKIELAAHKGALYTEASREVLADATEFQTAIVGGLRKSIATYMDEACLIGDGIKKPLGIINCPGSIFVNRLAANQFSFTDAVMMFSRVHGAFKNNAVWLINHDVTPQLLQFTDSNGNLIWVPSHAKGVSSDIPTTLLGRPVVYTEKVPALGTRGDVMLVDFSQYALGLRQEVTIDVSNAPGWSRDVTSFRTIVRVDGQGLFDKPITPMNGTNTLSPFVVLDIP